MSLIDDRYICDECGGYRTGLKTTLSSACKCPDYHPVTPGRHSVGGPTRGRVYNLPKGLVGE